MLRIAVPTNKPPEGVANYLNALTGCEASATAGRTFDPSAYDGLLLPGGWDVNPARYGEENTACETVEDDLDAIQFETLAQFLAAGKPVLGICRGHQLLNVFFGGTLIQHLPGAERHTALGEGKDNIHRVRSREGSFLQGIYGTECTVNSSHHQGIGIPGKGLTAVMHSEDGVIEGVVHETLPVWGVQWHPERMCFAHQRDDTADGSLIFRFFLEQCEKNRQE